MGNKLVSVVIPVYNGGKYINAALDSVLNQTYKNLEVILINDCSTDDTAQVLNKYIDPRIKILKNDVNLGISRTLNKGVSFANGHYIARMDSDDICMPTRIQQQVDFMEKNPDIEVCGTFIETFGIDNRISIYPVTSKEIKINLMFGCSMAHPTIMFKRTIIENYTYCEDSKVEDYKLWVELVKKGVNFHNIPLPLLKYRIHPNSLSHIKIDDEKKNNLVRDYVLTIKDANKSIIGYELSDKEIEILFLNPDMLSKDILETEILLLVFENYYSVCQEMLDKEELEICKSALSLKLYEKCIVLSLREYFSLKDFRNASFNIYKNSLKKNLVISYLYTKTRMKNLIQSRK